MISGSLDLHTLVDTNNPDDVLEEVRKIIAAAFHGNKMTRYDSCASDTLRLFRGEYKGYQPCKTEYHDLRHTMEVLLATARLIHACIVSGRTVNICDAELALIAALMHDVGYIQQLGETGSGGQHTLVHVERSADFFEKYGHSLGLDTAAIEDCCCMITATSLAIDPDDIHYRDPGTELMAKLVASADLLGQLADRFYLEKLLFLYREFNEAGLMAYPSEFDLLTQTRSFYTMVRRRLNEGLGSLDQILSHHFRVRWQTDRNLYAEAISLNLQYLDLIIRGHKEDYRSMLKRGGIVNRIMRAEGSTLSAEACYV